MTVPGRGLSLATRLTVGSIILLLILAAGLAVVLRSQSHSAELQRDFTNRISPRLAATHALEQRVQALAIVARSYLLTPEPVRLEQYEQAVMRVRDGVEHASRLMVGTSEADAIASLQRGVTQYLQVVERMVGRAPQGGITGEHELEMREISITLLASLRQVVEAQERQADAALASMSDARRDVWWALVVMSASLVV